jgi:hypothetical protein
VSSERSDTRASIIMHHVSRKKGRASEGARSLKVGHQRAKREKVGAYSMRGAKKGEGFSCTITTRKTSIGNTATRSASYMWCAAGIYP